MEQGAYDRAIADFTQALTLNPNYAPAYYYRAVTAFFQKDYTKAWADVKRYQQAGGKPNAQFLRDLRKASGQQR
jgi:Tfp pilus assembly protein PilF